MNKYSREIINNCRTLYTDHQMTPAAISEKMGGRPSESTIKKWAADENWFLDVKSPEEISPRAIAAKILKKISFLLEKENNEFTVKDAEAIARFQKALERITDIKYQLPVMYQMLTDLLIHIREEHPEVYSDKLITAIRHFKEKMKNRLNHEILR